MKVRFAVDWSSWLVGVKWDRKHAMAFVCPLPFLTFGVEFKPRRLAIKPSEPGLPARQMWVMYGDDVPPEGYRWF